VGKFGNFTSSIYQSCATMPYNIDLLRMGAGEDYVSEFSKAYDLLTQREKKFYELSYPAMGD